MPCSFLVVVGGDFTKINRHRYFRSPGIPGRTPRGQTQLEPLGRLHSNGLSAEWGKT
jgi:hypothetical protein